jgi:glycosyltransferase involved in cell wall biosynthesis
MRVVAVMEAHTVTGPAKNLIRFCKFAAERYSPDFEISVVTYLRRAANSARQTNEFIETVREAGVPLEIIPEDRAFDLQVISRLRALLRDRKPDIVQTHAVKSHFLMRLSRPSGARWLAYHHGYTDPDFKMRVYNQLDRWSLPAADRVVTVCQPFADMLAASGVERDRIRVLGNSIECFQGPSSETLSELRNKWNLPKDLPVVLTIGRLSAEKGHRYLISAASILKRERPDLDFKILILGEGHERPQLERQVEELGLGSTIQFAEHQHNPISYYALANVFVLPSLSEGSPNVLLEAMMAGTPAIATGVGGVPEMVQDEYSGLVVKPGDAAALARAIERVLKDSALAHRLRENASADVRAKHSPATYGTALMDIYRNLIAERTGR